MAEGITSESAGQLAGAAQTVLETMFFTTVVEPDEAEESPPAGDLVSARVRFRGRPDGMMLVTLPQSAARAIAATFLGVDEDDGLSEAQVDGVIREMANMICGAALSWLERDATFHLESPELVPSAALPDPANGLCCSLPLDCGPLQIRLVTAGGQ